MAKLVNINTRQYESILINLMIAYLAEHDLFFKEKNGKEITANFVHPDEYKSLEPNEERVFFLSSTLYPVPKINGTSISNLSFRGAFKFFVNEDGIPNFTCVNARVK